MMQKNFDRFPPIYRYAYSMIAGIAMLGAAMAGCGPNDNLNRQTVTGMVSLDGEPLKSGAILI